MESFSTPEEIKMRGYNPNQQIIIPDDNILQIGVYSCIQRPPRTLPKKMSLKKVKESTYHFYDTYFNLQRVPFFKELKIGPLSFELKGDSHPFGIPIKTVRKVDTLFGMTNEVIENIENNPILFYKAISLSSNTTSLSSLAYTHEIAHTQLNHVKGIIEEYYDTEVISIFLELVNAYEADSSELLLRQHDETRLTELSYIIKDLSDNQNSTDISIKDELVEASMYLQSTIKAYNLFIKYYYGTTSVKRAILSSIQKIFNQETTLNPILRDFDVSSDGSRNILQFKRYIKR